MESGTGSFSSVDAYIASFPADVQPILKSIRATIRAAAPDAEEKISYQMPAYAQRGNLVYFAGWKNHIGFYPTGSAITEFNDALSPYEIAKGTVKFPLSRPIPLELIGKIVAFRVRENLARAATKGGKRNA